MTLIELFDTDKALIITCMMQIEALDLLSTSDSVFKLVSLFTVIILYRAVQGPIVTELFRDLSRALAALQI